MASILTNFTPLILNKQMNKIKAIGLLTGIFLSVIVSAQKTMVYTHKDSEYETAIGLFQKEKYGAAQKSFVKVIETHNDPQSLVRIDAEYYNAICAIELFNKDGSNHIEFPEIVYKKCSKKSLIP